MMRRQMRFVLACKVVLLVACALLAAKFIESKDLLDSPGRPRNGRNLFLSKGCIRCHSVWESGQKRGPNLASVGMGRNLYELCASVWSHWSRMNAVIEQDNESWAALSEADIKDIIAYLYYLNYSSEPGEVDLGREVFINKGCGQCHAIDPLHAAGKPAKAIYQMEGGGAALAVAVWNHGHDMFVSMANRRLRWPQLGEKEVPHLINFLRSQSGAYPRNDMTLPGDPIQGQALFTAKACAGCHESGGDAPLLSAGRRDSGSIASLSSLIASLWNHYPSMHTQLASTGASYKKLERGDMEDILAYIYWLKAFDLAGDPTAGQKLFFSKQCALCHSQSNAQSLQAPDLEKSANMASAYKLLSAIWNHGPRMDVILREKNIPWPELSGEEMRDLVSFFRKGSEGRLELSRTRESP